MDNLKNVIWYDGKGYSYWEACSEIFQDANDLLKADLENLGVKIDVKTSSSNSANNSNKSSVNKSLFEFNDTFVDSIIQSQPSKQNKSINIKDKSIRVDKSVQEEKQEESAELISKSEASPVVEASKQVLSQCSNLKKEINSLKGLVLENTIINSQMSIDSPNVKVVNKRQPTLSQRANLLKEINSLDGLMLDSQTNDAGTGSAQNAPVQIEDSFHNEEDIKIDDSLQNESLKEIEGENVAAKYKLFLE